MIARSASRQNHITWIRKHVLQSRPEIVMLQHLTTIKQKCETQSRNISNSQSTCSQSTCALTLPSNPGSLSFSWSRAACSHQSFLESGTKKLNQNQTLNLEATFKKTHETALNQNQTKIKCLQQVLQIMHLASNSMGQMKDELWD